MLQGLECVTSEKILEYFGEQLEGFTFFRAIRSSQRPGCELLVCVVKIFPVKVLQKDGQVSALDHRRVRHLEDYEYFSAVGRAPFKPLSFSHRP